MPTRYDLGILTTNGPELSAVQMAFNIDNFENRFNKSGYLYWNASILSSVSKNEISIVLHCIGEPGNTNSAEATSRLINDFNPSFVVLVGIAAGIEGKCKIGDVIVPAAIIDYTIKEVTEDRIYNRPLIYPLPIQTSQMYNSFYFNKMVWHKQLKSLLKKMTRKGLIGDEFGEETAEGNPEVHHSAIASADILLRDGRSLTDLSNNIHSKIAIGEMEAAGFCKSCQRRIPSIPWIIVRGVSDYGDSRKDDKFHLRYFLVEGFDKGLLQNSETRKGGPDVEGKRLRYNHLKLVEKSDNIMDRALGLKYLLNDLPMYVEKISREKRDIKISSVLIDIDGQTQINSTHGSDVGDYVIQIVATIVCDEFRDCQSMRCGGDTFIILIENCKLEEAVAKSKKLIGRIRNFKWQDISSGLWVTSSCGVAMLGHKENVNDWINRTIIGLNTAKKNGGNTVRSGPKYLPKSERNDSIKLAAFTYKLISNAKHQP